MENLEQSIDSAIPVPQKNPNLEKKPLNTIGIDNERDNKNIPILKPLAKEEITPEFLQPLFTYLSRTKNLEVETPKTIHLQKIADKMTKDFDFKTRIVIMGKGKESVAFCTPDGTIFISQNVINHLNTDDKIGAVIAHEIGHIRRKTFEISNKTWNKLGVGWVHEAAADLEAPSLLEKAELNSLAFADMIEAISGFERGVIHQGGLARSSQNVGAHLAIHYKTSAKEPTPKPEFLNSETVPTNMELFNEAYNEQNTKAISAILEKLHPNDLKDSYRILSRLKKSEKEGDKIIKEDEKEIASYSKAAGEIRKVLATAGATEDEQTILLMCMQPYQYRTDPTENFRRFNEIKKDPKKIVELSKLLSNDQALERFNKLYSDAFDEKLSNYQNASELFIETLGNNLVDLTATPEARGIPVNEESILDTLAAVYFNKNAWDRRDKQILGIVLEYIKRSNLKSAQVDVKRTSNFGESNLDEAKVSSFLEKVRDKKIFSGEEVFKRMHVVANTNTFRDHAGKQYEFTHESNERLEELIKKIWTLEDEQPQLLKEKDIQPFFEKLKEDPGGYNAEKKLDDFSNLVGYSFKYEEEDLKLQTAQKIMAEMSNSLQAVSFYAKSLNFDYENLTDEKKEIFMHQGMLKYGIALGAKVFREDSDQFYTFMNDLMAEHFTTDLSHELAVLFSRPLLTGDTISLKIPAGKKEIDGLIQTTKPIQLGKFSELPIIKRALEYDAAQDVTTIENLNDKFKKENIFKYDKNYPTDNVNIFTDALDSLMIGQGYRQKLLELAKIGLPISSFEALHETIERAYPDGPERTFFLRQINKKILTSPEISFENKLKYLNNHLDETGPEGLSLLAEQIEDFNTYGEFRKQMKKNIDGYLSGESATFSVAAVDYVSSFFAKNFKDLFALSKSDPVSQRESSTKFAEQWIKHFTERGSLGARYDFNSGKIIIAENGRQTFRTVSELIDMLHDLTPFQRSAIAYKALTEKDGAFSSQENRKILANQIIDSMKIKDPFVMESIKVACEKGDAKFLVIPASQMIGQLLFQGLNKEAIDKEKISEMEIRNPEKIFPEPGEKVINNIKDLPTDDLMRSLSVGAREISVFGSKYNLYPNTPFYKLAEKSDNEFYQLTKQLHELLDDPSEKIKENKPFNIDPSIEAPIKGVESSGALGVRSLQLITQMQEFSEPVRKRLSESFDSNPGINKLLFWENLFKIAGENPEAKRFIEHISLKNKAGGGSLYTTYKGEIDEEGKKRDIVIKMLNPNSEAFLKNSKFLGESILEEVGERNPNMKKTADMGLVLTALACQWSLKDMNDPTFVKDDDNFKKIVKSFNERTQAKKYTVPERIFNSYKLKSEELAHGRTINNIVNDENVSYETKQKIVERMSEFFTYQLKAPKIQEGEKEYVLVHSDPHVGNYMLDLEKEDSPIAVIDRHMYLKLEKEDLAVLNEFILDNDLEFISAFTNRILKVNKVKNRFERTIINTRIMAEIMSNYAFQRLHGSVDSFSILKTTLEKFTERGLEIPLNLRLMIRNVQALKNLTEQYGLNFQEIYKNYNAPNQHPLVSSSLPD